MTWRPAVIVDDLPQPLTGAAATTALAAGTPPAACTDVTATPGGPDRHRRDRVLAGAPGGGATALGGYQLSGASGGSAAPARRSS